MATKKVCDACGKEKIVDTYGADLEGTVDPWFLLKRPEVLGEFNQDINEYEKLKEEIRAELCCAICVINHLNEANYD